MPSLVSSIRSVLLHTIWYLDWRTGGNTVLDAGRQSTA
jgi:hypothetical protein